MNHPSCIFRAIKLYWHFNNTGQQNYLRLLLAQVCSASRFLWWVEVCRRDWNVVPPSGRTVAELRVPEELNLQSKPSFFHSTFEFYPWRSICSTPSVGHHSVYGTVINTRKLTAVSDPPRQIHWIGGFVLFENSIDGRRFVQAIA